MTRDTNIAHKPDTDIGHYTLSAGFDFTLGLVALGVFATVLAVLGFTVL